VWTRRARKDDRVSTGPDIRLGGRMLRPQHLLLRSAVSDRASQQDTAPPACTQGSFTLQSAVVSEAGF
jgi:hypothetical protein